MFRPKLSCTKEYHIYNNFIKQCMIIKKVHVYQNIDYTFNLLNSNIIHEGKLIIADIDPHELIRKIIYAIRITIRQEIPNILRISNKL